MKYSFMLTTICNYLFYSQDPNYPIPLIECIRGCWAQDYTQRPSAKIIEESFKSPNCLRLKNSYKLKTTAVHAVLVTKVMRDDVDEELVWVADKSTACQIFSAKENITASFVTAKAILSEQ